MIAGATLLGALTAVLGVVIFYRQLRSMSKANEFGALERAQKIISEQFKGVEGGAARFYELKDVFDKATPKAWGPTAYRTAMEQRFETVMAMSPQERLSQLQIIEPVVNALNNLAELIDLDFLDAPKILSKYHMMLAREAFLLEPYILDEVLVENRGRWAYRVLRLGEMARMYNDINPVHRRDIYFLHGRQPDKEFGAIYLKPESAWLWALRLRWRLRRSLLGYPTITERAKRQQNKEMENLRAEKSARIRRAQSERAGRDEEVDPH